MRAERFFYVLSKLSGVAGERRDDFIDASSQ